MKSFWDSLWCIIFKRTLRITVLKASWSCPFCVFNHLKFRKHLLQSWDNMKIPKLDFLMMQDNIILFFWWCQVRNITKTDYCCKLAPKGGCSVYLSYLARSFFNLLSLVTSRALKLCERKQAGIYETSKLDNHVIWRKNYVISSVQPPLWSAILDFSAFSKTS